VNNVYKSSKDRKGFTNRTLIPLKDPGYRFYDAHPIPEGENAFTNRMTDRKGCQNILLWQMHTIRHKELMKIISAFSHLIGIDNINTQLLLPFP
jgi:hypothetical protein